MKKYFDAALTNILRHGDTDIFPFPIENHVFFDRKSEIISCLEELHASFGDFLSRYSPTHESSLIPISYSGFRWATQLDPIWNAYFLSCVISIAQDIETARIPLENNIVFSYRYKYDS